MTENIYVQQCCDTEGCEAWDIYAEMRNSIPRKREFPLTLHGFTYETKQEYEDALHEFLNEN